MDCPGTSLTTADNAGFQQAAQGRKGQDHVLVKKMFAASYARRARQPDQVPRAASAQARHAGRVAGLSWRVDLLSSRGLNVFLSVHFLLTYFPCQTLSLTSTLELEYVCLMTSLFSM